MTTPGGRGSFRPQTLSLVSHPDEPAYTRNTKQLLSHKRRNVMRPERRRHAQTANPPEPETPLSLSMPDRGPSRQPSMRGPATRPTDRLADSA